MSLRELIWGVGVLRFAESRLGYILFTSHLEFGLFMVK